VAAVERIQGPPIIYINGWERIRPGIGCYTLWESQLLLQSIRMGLLDNHHYKLLDILNGTFVLTLVYNVVAERTSFGSLFWWFAAFAYTINSTNKLVCIDLGRRSCRYLS